MAISAMLAPPTLGVLPANLSTFLYRQVPHRVHGHPARRHAASNRAAQAKRRQKP